MGMPTEAGGPTDDVEDLRLVDDVVKSDRFQRMDGSLSA